MLYLVRMDVSIPPTLSVEEAEAVKLAEREYSLALQADGRWVELWRVVGEYANYSLFDVAGNQELHNLLSALPLFAFMKMTITPLAEHPSRLHRD